MTTGVPHHFDPSSPGSAGGGDSRRPRRSRARTLVPLGIAAWLVLEIWLLTVVADAAGGLTVFLLLVGGLVLGSIVIKRAGRRAWQSLAGSLQQPGAVRPEEAGRAAPGTGNSFVMLGGLLLMLPGLVSDALALLCLFPPTRALLRRWAERALERRMRTVVPGSVQDAFEQARMRQPEGKVVQGEVIRDDDPARGEGGPRDGGRQDPPLTR
ncbi:FxsA family membrane protein [Streptomyces sp. XD-27]|uniref:FxsA family membrane protein n=1 Tax=Streptomyces sp. XD-27 TaxID=3062779 RepID=UPI0026F46AE0|nr:FxsA family membrane protein [Streptomyces sp. XD-27]WKX73531.1 FxsA family membrane protein [Streptomyces sp. XD-27]